MNAITRRIRRLEEKLAPPAATAESKRIHDIILGIQRRRAARLGLPIPEEVPLPAREYPPGTTIAGILRARFARRATQMAAESSGAITPPAGCGGDGGTPDA